MFAEPPPTPYDWNFRLFGFPVRIHPFFWMVGALLYTWNIGNMRLWLLGLSAWIAAMFVSILVHELGHALVFRYVFRVIPSITLYGFGGVTSARHLGRVPNFASSVLLSAAGPLAGFALILFYTFIVAVTGGSVSAIWFQMATFLQIPFLQLYPSPHIVVLPAAVQIFTVHFLYNSVFIGMVWGCLNLLPIYPLDGGNIAREICLIINRRRGVLWSLWISVGTAGTIAVFSLLQFFAEKSTGIPFTPIMFGFLAFQSYQFLQRPR